LGLRLGIAPEEAGENCAPDVFDRKDAGADLDDSTDDIAATASRIDDFANDAGVAAAGDAVGDALTRTQSLR
jgi:hypothetical protein